MNSSPYDESNLQRLQTLVADASSERERLERVWNDYRERVFPNFAPSPKDEKNLSIAQAAKEQGNRLYASKNYRGALISYNKALCSAPNGSQLVALLYANRSAVYLATKLPLQSLENIDLALENGYPADKREKLEERRAECLRLIETLPDREVNIKPHPPKKPMLSHPANPKYAFLSNAVDLVIDPTLGPQLIAKQDLKIGDFFFKEPACMKTVDPSSQDDCFAKCSYCIKGGFLSLAPCQGCTTVMFCKDCVEKVQGIHQLECPNWAQDPFTPLCIRACVQILAMHSLDALKKTIQECKENREKVLEGDYGDMESVKKEVFKWLIPRWKPQDHKTWMTNTIKSSTLLNLLLRSPPIKALVSTPEKEITVLEILFSLFCVNYFNFRSIGHNENSFNPLFCRFSVSDGVDFKSIFIYDQEVLFGECILPVKKGEAIKMATDNAFSIRVTRNTPPTLLYNPNMLLSYFKSRMPALLSIPKGVKFDNFNASLEIQQIFLGQYDLSSTNMKRLVRILSENMHLYPCFELTTVMFVYACNRNLQVTDVEYRVKEDMMLEMIPLMSNLNIKD